ncbi:MogA/MoaB family molybdenum cofactor biosynthesis protein [Subtercola sp. YIM 133946]|uniref:MogA/MoaB family molybdenum cofactor biosynthesis protein n=1 Tax=Subtercola sp. YIM 133946 TaxID=3118909 RepID=UPI002F926987
MSDAAAVPDPVSAAPSGDTSAPDAAAHAAGDRTAAVLIVSTRAATGVYDDLTGPLIRDWLRDHGWSVPAPHVVADGPGVTTALRGLVAGQPRLIVTSGGTGIHPADRTPDQTRALLDYEIPGFAEELRRRGSLKIASALLSRGVAGVAGDTIVVNLPGSTGGVKDGLGLLDEVLDHMIDQLKGGDHAR